jgi:hypothetical protein
MIRHDDFLHKLDKASKSSRYIKGVCPFHDDDDPSLLVWDDGWFKCLGCNRQGSWKMLWNKLQGQHIIIRPDKKVEWAGPPPVEDLEQTCYQSHLDLVKFSSFQWYLEMRGLTESIESNELGYYEGWYTVPVTAANGTFITAVFRASPLVQSVTNIRYVCKHVPVPFFPNHRLVKKTDYLFVVYGIFDALTLSQLGYPVVTSTAGKDTFNPEWLNYHRGRIFIIPDKGEEATAYGLASQLDYRGKVINLDWPDKVKDCNGYLEKGKGDVLRTTLHNIVREL